MSKNFEEVFLEKVDEIEARARATGRSLTTICRETKVSRATPDRWRKKMPKTIKLVREMEEIVTAWEKEPAVVEIDGIPQKIANGATAGLHADE